MNSRLVLAGAAIALAGCATQSNAIPVPTTSSTLCLLSPFSRSADGSVTRTDMEAAVAAAFAAADTNANGNLEFSEMARINAARAGGCDQTELRDWSGAGRVGIDDYAARYRTAFDMADVNEDGFATRDEMLYAKPKPPRPKRAPLTPDNTTQTGGSMTY